MKSARVRDGTALQYEVYGKGHPLVLVPGLGASARVWGAFPQALGAWFRVVAFDPRGFGASPAAPETITMETMVSDLVDLLDALEIPRAHFFGVSMGGIVLQRLAAAHPDRVARLVLVSTTGRMSPWARRMLDVFEILTARLDPGEYVRVMAALSLSPAFFEGGRSKPEDFEKALEPRPEEMASIPPQIAAVRSIAGEPPAADRIGAPVLILSGRQDFLTPPFSAAALHAALPDARWVELEGGHACLMEATEEGLVHVLGFLRESEGP